MNRIILLLLVALSFTCCQSQEMISVKEEYPRWVGDLKENKSDNSNFELCKGESSVIQYFNDSKGLEYNGGKSEIEKIFKEAYVPLNKENQNGIIRIRFIVNCKGETGRFRVLEADNNYKEFQFDDKISSQLLEITKSLSDWETKEYHNEEADYYQYLIFKIVNGDISEILP